VRERDREGDLINKTELLICAIDRSFARGDIFVFNISPNRKQI
jgi:hypothetical protein